MHFAFTNLWNKAMMPADLDKNVTFLMTEEQTERYRKDYEFRLEVHAERESKMRM